MTTTRLLPLLSVALLGAGCATPAGAPSADPTAADTVRAAPTERATATPRLALSYDGGVLVVDADTLDQVADIPVEGFVRLNPAANGRHVFVSQTDGFAVLDMGTWTDAHGDHGHHYTAEPVMTDLRFGGDQPGHVVAHDGKVTLFSDGTGAAEVVDPHALLDGVAVAETRVTTTPHHGVAVAREDGTVVVSVGDDDGRTGLQILDATDSVIAADDRCPGLHGEAAAAAGVLTFGCEDGLLIVRGNDIQKVASPDPYGRIGNQAGSDASTGVLGDYKTDPDAEIERPQRFTLTDTATGTLRVVPLGTSYSFRSLDRGADGEAVILGTDGALHVFDPVSAQRIGHFGAVPAWTEPDEWQSPMPDLHVQDDVAYVSDPRARRLLAIDLADGAVLAETTLAHPAIEMTGVEG
ncbi:zinc metallochaperone AztD [Mycobacterium sp. ITM-2016-00317]|uniref:zinc metallochaperone AztD n=1 Tax=Mycobacterium sp. ITM-2016-00317 TaxID=2099694 RepID=UPI000D4AE6D3|nr:zinc metallochaperone AztD [Mycobacterium sp. ITM-2016-00317]WNG90025.1 zinc metallochaperone AztD [Mycobacterium sp. ITM-2016-00317]